MSHFIFTLIFSLRLYTIDCGSLPDSFISYSVAEAEIKAANWKIKDYVDCSKSSWIREASYYSCDGNIGYFLIKTNAGRSYLHKDVPKILWNQFKGTSSFGTFYNVYYKGKYQMHLKN